MKIVDCFIFYNELKLLQFRMNYLYDYVDHFILVESSLTHSGNPKPFFFEENKNLFEPYLSKIVHIKVYDDLQKPFQLTFRKNIIEKKYKIEECKNRGSFQRNCIERGFKILNLADDDIIISSDADEFIDRNTITKLRKTGLNGIYSLEQDLYYYNLNCKSKYIWNLAHCMNYNSYKTINNNLSFIRSIKEKYPVLEKSGWHFSYFGNIDFIIDKIKQSADQRFNQNEFLNREIILEKIKNGEDLFDRGEEFEIIPIDRNTYLPEGYEYLIKMTI